MNDDILAAYHRLIVERGGVLPTTREIAQMTGTKTARVRRRLTRRGLPYTRYADSSLQKEINRSRREAAEAAFAEKHMELTRETGRYPTREEMNQAMGYTKKSSRSVELAKRLSLELTRKRRRQENPEIRVIAPANTEFRFGSGMSPRMERILAIQGGTETAPGEGLEYRPGEAYAATDRIMLTCPVCGARKLIAPRMHPYWVRNKAGAVIFVCRDACTGRITGG